jgi:transposase-like protein
MEFWTTKTVAEAFNVNPNTLRNWINTGRISEPEWGRRGTRKQRHYTREWIKQASEKLQINVNWEKLGG